MVLFENSHNAIQCVAIGCVEKMNDDLFCIEVWSYNKVSHLFNILKFNQFLRTVRIARNLAQPQSWCSWITTHILYFGFICKCVYYACIVYLYVRVWNIAFCVSFKTIQFRIAIFFQHIHKFTEFFLSNEQFLFSKFIEWAVKRCTAKNTEFLHLLEWYAGDL